LLRRSQWLVAEKTATKGRAANGKDANASAATANVGSSADSAPDAEVFSFNGKTIDFGTLELRVNGTTIQLTLMEAKLLRHLIRSKGRTVSRKSILEDVWGLHEDTDTRAIDNFIVRLRRYIEKDPSKPQHLLTVRGVGYRFLA
jgi:two-component system, OmpR family, alkaline phosphatase synthesis response regulator PhoP